MFKMRAFPMLLPLAALLALPVTGMAEETVQGIINGYGCTVKGETCPTKRTDPHLAMEREFVLLTSGGDYYLMPNVPRDTKVRYVLMHAQVTGTMDNKHDAIYVDVLKIKRGDSYKTVWSKEWAMMERQRLFREEGAPGPALSE